MGHLPPDFKQQPQSVYCTGLLVAMLQLVGSVSTVTPANVPEYLFFFLAIAIGTVLIAAVQGVICGVVTNGDPDEIAWRQVGFRGTPPQWPPMRPHPTRSPGGRWASVGTPGGARLRPACGCCGATLT